MAYPFRHFTTFQTFKTEFNVVLLLKLSYFKLHATLALSGRETAAEGFEMEKVGVDCYINSTSMLALYAIAPPI